jgi:NADH:ubiquinone oxidoreductase subunit 5 (subunit L)/multisubunit Na+/H+ antiporter MnhA subunit
MLILIILFPFLGFLSGSLFGRFLNKGVCFVTTFFTFSSFMLSFMLLLDIVQSGNIYILNVTEWIYTDSLELD